MRSAGIRASVYRLHVRTTFPPAVVFCHFTAGWGSQRLLEPLRGSVRGERSEEEEEEEHERSPSPLFPHAALFLHFVLLLTSWASDSVFSRDLFMGLFLFICFFPPHPSRCKTACFSLAAGQNWQFWRNAALVGLLRVRMPVNDKQTKRLCFGLWAGLYQMENKLEG